MPVQRNVKAILLAAAIALAGNSAASAELISQPVLSHQDAMRMVAACVSLAEENGWRVGIAVKDTGDDLKAYLRMDGAPLGAAQMAEMKASTSARGPWSSAQLGQYAFDEETGAANALAFVDGNIMFGGGLPIMTQDGEHLGAIGVSGGTEEQDVACAQAGIDAIKDVLQ